MTIQKYNCVLFLLAFLITIPLLSQHNLKQVDQYLSTVYEKGITPGFSIGIVKGDKVVYTKGFGVEVQGEKKPMTSKSVMRIGSITKSFTTIAVLQLVEQGKLDLDVPITTYLPWFQTANKEYSDQITLRMLLNNTSGLPGSSIGTASTEISMKALEDRLKTLKAEVLKQRPGLRYEYSNLGFNLAGFIVSKVSNQNYWDYLEEHIFRPIGMESSTTDPRLLQQFGVLAGHNYGIRAAIPQQQGKPSALDLPAGSFLSSTAEDMAQYLRLFLNHGKVGDKRIISAESLYAMTSAQVSYYGRDLYLGCEGPDWNYCFALNQTNEEGKELLFHGGSTGVSSSLMMYSPEDQTGVIFLANLDLTFLDKFNYESEYNICFNVLRLLAGEPLSSAGQPCVKDKTLNSYSLPDSLKKHFSGKYRIANSRLFTFDNTDLWITTSAKNKLIGTIKRDNHTIMEFQLDFVNPVLAVNRNLAMPFYCTFKRSLSGKIKEFLCFGNQYIKVSEKEWEGYWANDQLKIPVQLKSGWTMTSGIVPSGHHDQIRLQSNKPSSNLINKSPTQYLQLNEHQWKQLSWVSRKQKTYTQYILFWTQHMGKDYWIQFEVPRNDFQALSTMIIHPLFDNLQLP